MFRYYTLYLTILNNFSMIFHYFRHQEKNTKSTSKTITREVLIKPDSNEAVKPVVNESSSSGNSGDFFFMKPASVDRSRKGTYSVTCGQLPYGAIVHARISEGKDLEMQEHYKARVVRRWPSRPRPQHGTGLETELVALHFIDDRISKNLPQQRKGKPPLSHYVEPNDVRECRVPLKSQLISDGFVEPGTKVSVNYLFQGKRVRGWTGFYPGTVVEHCTDGTVLVKYLHESPTHEEYLKCSQIQFPVLQEN